MIITMRMTLINWANRRRAQFIKWVELFPGEYSWEFVVGVCRPALHILTLVETNTYRANVREYATGIFVVKK